LIIAAIILGRMADGRWSAVVHPLDYRAALLIHSLQSPLFDLPLRSLSWIGEMIPMALATSAFFAYLVFRGRKASALLTALSMPGTAIMWKITALTVHRQRPNFWIHHPAWDIGYPGGHVMNAVVIAGVCMAMTLPRLQARWQKVALILLWVLFIVGTAVARIYVNAHFLSDNIAGFSMGLIWVLLAVPIVRWAFPNCRDAA
jgi:undecaprenyl-diphosphatase